MIWEKPCRGGERLSLEELNQYRQWMLEPLKVLRQAFKEENATILLLPRFCARSLKA